MGHATCSSEEMQQWIPATEPRASQANASYGSSAISITVTMSDDLGCITDCSWTTIIKCPWLALNGRHNFAPRTKTNKRIKNHITTVATPIGRLSTGAPDVTPQSFVWLVLWMLRTLNQAKNALFSFKLSNCVTKNEYHDNRALLFQYFMLFYHLPLVPLKTAFLFKKKAAAKFGKHE